MIISCAGSLAHFSYTRIPINSNINKVIQVYIDQDFSTDDRLAIDNALNDWNYALNNYIHFQVVSIDFDMNPTDIKNITDDGGLGFLKIDSHSPFIPPSTTGRVLAFTDRIGGHFVFVIRDRLKSELLLEDSVRHEIGHALGSVHSVGDRSLMSPRISKDYDQCIDQETMIKVAYANGLDSSKLNYCVYE